MRPYLLDQFQLFVANVAAYRFSDRLVNFFDESFFQVFCRWPIQEHEVRQRGQLGLGEKGEETMRAAGEEEEML